MKVASVSNRLEFDADFLALFDKNREVFHAKV